MSGVTLDSPIPITNPGHKPFMGLHKFPFFNLKKKKSKAPVISAAGSWVAGSVASPATPQMGNTPTTGDESNESRSESAPVPVGSWTGTLPSDAGIRFYPQRYPLERQMSADSSTSFLSTDSGNPYQRDSYQSFSSQSSNEIGATQESAAIPPVPNREAPPPPYTIEAQESSSQPSATQETQPTEAGPSTREVDVDAESRYSFDESAPPDDSIVASLLRDSLPPPAADQEDIWELEVLDQIRRMFLHSLQSGPPPLIQSPRPGKQQPLPGTYPRSPSSSVRRSPALSRRYHGRHPQRHPTTRPPYGMQWDRDITDAEIDGLGLIDSSHFERLARMEEEDRAFAEELQRVEQEELEQLEREQEMQAEEIRRMQEREEAMRLEDLKRIAREDELLAQSLMAQERRDFDAERQRREKEEKDNKAKHKRIDITAMLKAEAVSKIGAPVSVRRVNPWGTIMEASNNELTPEIVKHLKHLVQVFTKNIPEHRIVKLEWIVNRRLETQFESTRQQLKKAKHSTKEMLLFHGTASKNVNK